jgi:hypothetical protein
MVIFNSIEAVIDFFGDQLGMVPGSDWMSLADAGVLLAIQEGQYVLDTGKHHDFFSDRTLNGMLRDAGNNWAAMFCLVLDTGGNWDKYGTEYLKAYGLAEQTGADFGQKLADSSTRKRPDVKGLQGFVLDAFISVGDATRSAQRSGDSGAFGTNDPRNGELVRNALNVFYGEMAATWSQMYNRNQYQYYP